MIVSGDHKPKCAEDPGNATANDTPVVISDCNGSAGQVWIVEPGGTLQVNGKCMDIYRDEKTSKAPVELWTCTGDANQQWKATNGTLVNPASGKCLDDPGFSTAEAPVAAPSCMPRRFLRPPPVVSSMVPGGMR